MRTGALIITALLAAGGCAADKPDPTATLPPETVETLDKQSLACLDGDNAACNRLRALARSEAPGSSYEHLGATCGGRVDEPLDYLDWCDV